MGLVATATTLSLFRPAPGAQCARALFDGEAVARGCEVGVRDRASSWPVVLLQCRGLHHPMAALEGELEAALDEDLLQRSAARIQASVRGFLVRRRQHNAAVAAAKIQAGFRGYRTRRELRQRNGLRGANKNGVKVNMTAARQAAQ